MSAKYDAIGQSYNTTRKPDPYIVERLLDLLEPQQNGNYLDIGCGTGNYTNKLAGTTFPFTGVDPSLKMINQARNKRPDLEWQIGSAEENQLTENNFDGVVGTMTIHHWTSLEKGCSEMNRVLKTDGSFVLFTSTSEQMKSYWLNHYFPDMMEVSIRQMPDLMQIKNALVNAGFTITEIAPYFVKNDLQDQFLYCGKNKPAVYLKEEVRNGISSFADIAHAEEVSRGLEALEQDITQGQIHKIIDQYTSDIGDYLFIKALKTHDVE